MRIATTLFAVFAFTGLAQGQDVAAGQRAAGMSAYWKLHFQEAEDHFQAAVDADPQSAAAMYYLAYTVYKIAEPKRPNDPGKRRAAELFAKAYDLDPGFTPSWGIAGRP